MSEKMLKAVFGTLAGLVIVYALVSFMTRPGGSSPGGGGVASALEGLDDRSVQSVRIAGPSDTIVLERQATEWTVNGFRADSAAVARLWTALAETRVGSLAASNPDNHERLGVAGPEVWSVSFATGEDERREILIGKTGPAFRTAYVRLPGEEAVYSVEGDLRGALTRTLVDWRDKVIVRADTAAVRTIVVERDGSATTLVRGDSAWTLGEGGEAADGTTAEAVLRELADLRGTGFPPDGPFPEEGRRRVVALGADGDTLASVELAPIEGSFRVRTREGGTVFELSSFRADRIAPAADRLRSPEG